MAAAPAAAAASATLIEPNTLVLMPSSQSVSSSGTCLSAAAWNTMSGLNCGDQRHDARAVAHVGEAAGNLGLGLHAGELFQHGVQRRLGILHHQQAGGAEDQHALADFRADRAAAAGDDDRPCR